MVWVVVIMKPHKHAELIKAWADGAEIESRILCTGTWTWGEWRLNETPSWWAVETIEYRIKPQEPKPDVVVHEHIRFWRGNILAEPDRKTNIRYVFDGETHLLKSVEMLK